MPLNKTTAAAVAILAAGAFLGYHHVMFSQRKPASELPASQLKLKPWSHSTEQKLNQVISVHISTLDGVPDNDDQEIRLKAEVTLNRSVDGGEVQFSWLLPPGATVVSGELEDSWPGLKPGQTATTEISLLNVSKEGIAKTVTLNVSALGGGFRYASSGSFATNSYEQLRAAKNQDSKKLQDSEELVLNKSRAAEKMDKVHQ